MNDDKKTNNQPHDPDTKEPTPASGIGPEPDPREEVEPLPAADEEDTD